MRLRKDPTPAPTHRETGSRRKLSARERLGLTLASTAAVTGMVVPLASSGGDHVAPSSATSSSSTTLTPPAHPGYVAPTGSRPPLDTHPQPTSPATVTPEPTQPQEPTRPAKPPKPPLTNHITHRMHPKVTQVAPGIVQGVVPNGSMVAIDLKVAGTRIEVVGPQHAGELPGTMREHIKNAKVVANGEMFHFGADHPQALDPTTNMLGVLGYARSNGKDWPKGEAINPPGGNYLEFGKWGVRVVTKDRKPDPKAVDVMGVHDIVWQDGKSVAGKLGHSTFIEGKFGRTIFAVNEDGSRLYIWVNNANHGMTVPEAAQAAVNMAHAMKLPAVKWAFNEDGGGSSSVSTSKGLEDTLGRPLVSAIAFLFNLKAHHAGTHFNWSEPVEKGVEPVGHRPGPQ
ncbi:MAG: phosphodiester glycosidase family protein [Archangiaceae bacterium]|nr:phosphodiester glycosidase family protein [Archangiaceae bacterium]